MFIYTSILFTEPAVTISSWSSLVIQFENNHIPERFLDWTLSSLVAPQLPLINREKKKEKRGREREKKRTMGDMRSNAFTQSQFSSSFHHIYHSFPSCEVSRSINGKKTLYSNYLCSFLLFFIVMLVESLCLGTDEWQREQKRNTNCFFLMNDKVWKPVS